MVAWRCRVFALPYGDQGLLISRRTLHRAGGMRPLPLMEDVDLIRRLGRRKLIALTAGAMTSAAKWERDGWYRRSCRNLICLSLWHAGVPAHRVVAPASLLRALATLRRNVPAYSRQNGLACSACHYQFPHLTPFGSKFKLNGYTLTGLKVIRQPCDSAW